MRHENRLRHGKLFEMGPDGYGYLLDESTPGRSYAFHVSMARGPVTVSDVADLEDAEVSFTLVDDRPAKIEIIRPKAKAREVGR